MRWPGSAACREHQKHSKSIRAKTRHGPNRPNAPSAAKAWPLRPERPGVHPKLVVLIAEWFLPLSPRMLCRGVHIVPEAPEVKQDWLKKTARNCEPYENANPTNETTQQTSYANKGPGRRRHRKGWGAWNRNTPAGLSRQHCSYLPASGQRSGTIGAELGYLHLLANSIFSNQYDNVMTVESAGKFRRGQ